jgi:hypothetical protein
MKQLIEKQKELIKIYESFHTYSSIKVDTLKSEISAIEGRMKEEQPLKTREEMLIKHLLAMPDGNMEDYQEAQREEPETHNAILEAMEEYRSQGVREEIPLILDEFEKGELKALRGMQSDSNAFMSNERYDRLKELAKREFGFDMGYDNPFGNLFRTKEGKVIQGGLNAKVSKPR